MTFLMRIRRVDKRVKKVFFFFSARYETVFNVEEVRLLHVV